MSRGFSRFGAPSARERFHAQARRGGSFTMLLPTILATLFLFTAVIALNKLTGMSNGKPIRLLPVEDVFPTQAEVAQVRQKEYWEAPPPPSPESVIAALHGNNAVSTEEPAAEGMAVDGSVMRLPPPRTGGPTRPLPAIDTRITMPKVQPDISLPETVKP